MAKDGIKVNFGGTGKIIGGAGRSPRVQVMCHCPTSQLLYFELKSFGPSQCYFVWTKLWPCYDL